MSRCTHFVRCFDEIILSKHLKSWKEFRLALDEYEKTFTNFSVRDSKKCADPNVRYFPSNTPISYFQGFYMGFMGISWAADGQ